MKKLLFFATFFTFLSGTFAQGINYQALARYADGSTITDQAITVEISIFLEEGSSTSLYKEIHNLSTDSYGLFNLVIGGGTPAGGSFSTIDWRKAPLYLGVSLNAGSGFTDLGRHPLQGTPFSFYSKESGKAIDMMLSDLTDVQTAAPATGQVLKWNGSSWAPAADDGQIYSAGTGISISGNTISNTGDLSNTNELQNLSVNGNQLSISSGNTVTLPTGDGGDNWGSQTVASNATLSGLGTLASPLKIDQQNASNGQVLKWNGSTWAPAADNGQTYIAGTGISIVGNTITNTGDTNPNDDITITTQAGGDISGPFSNLQINANAIGTNEIANGSITAADLAAGLIPTTLPPTGSAGGDLSGTYPNPVVNRLQGRSVSNTAPTSGQVLRYNGTAWEPATPTGNSVWSTNNTNAFYNTGNVGVGTNSPHNRMQLHNSDIFAGSPSALQLTNNNTGTGANNGLLLTLNSTLADFGLMGGLMMRENAPLGLGTNGDYHLFLKQSGLLGLGTFTPQGKMEIDYNSTNHTNPNLMLTHSTNSYSRISFRSDIAADKYWTLASRTQENDAASQFNLFYHNGTTGSNILSINGSGNVGIGNITPSEKFHVDGNARISNLGINTSPTERLDVNGNIRLTGEVNRPSTGAANLVPICYGNINGAGEINSGSGNFTALRTSTGGYEITITGENFFSDSYVVQATPKGSVGFIYTTSLNGKLLVRTWIPGIAGGVSPDDMSFNFVVYKP